jgi:hypothetical protein
VSTGDDEEEEEHMLRQRSDEEYQTSAAGGTRNLFQLGQYEFHDTLDDEEVMHHFILEAAAGDEDRQAYEVDRETMYEFMARYLAGLYELEKYALEQSPSHNTLLDLLEIAAARARSGETEFSWDEFDRAESEVLESDEADAEPEEEQ